ncbi:MAG TPA: plastocyanin/azurin family copper-binding protein [Opitutaceae bacterium]|nr:plastocyanin/azurin family copper-binding protein [Opitutaceae bacterium]
MKTRIRPLLVAAALLAALPVLLAASDAVKTVDITANDTLRFNVTRIEAAPGQTLRIVLHNGGTVPKEVMGHNWVLLAAGENPDSYTAAALTAKAENYEPAALKSNVLAAIPLLGPGQTAEVTFTAPTIPGTYTYLCSFPAHCGAGMRGVLVVR